MTFIRDVFGFGKNLKSWRSMSPEEQEESKAIANRAARRSVQIQGQRLKGAGYTRSMRRGREQRERATVATHRPVRYRPRLRGRAARAARRWLSHDGGQS